MRILVLFILLAVGSAPLIAQPAQRSDIILPQDPGAVDPRIAKATAAIADGKPLDALAGLDELITQREAEHPAKPDTVYFSAGSLVEALVYAAGPASMKNGTTVIVADGNWSKAYFLKGFALIDAQRSDEAIGWFDRAVVLSPMNAQFIAERAEWYKMRRDWVRAYDGFEEALGAAEFSADDMKVLHKGRALRGMAFARVEQGRLKEAEKLIRQALELNPDDGKARDELAFIRDQLGSIN